MPARRVQVGVFKVEVVNTFIHVPVSEEEPFSPASEHGTAAGQARPRAASCQPTGHREILATEREAEEITTVMIRGVPRRMTVEKLLANLDDAGFEGEYDYVYLPGNHRTRVNKSIAFLNMRTPEAAQRVRRTLHKKKWGDAKMQINTARCQGIYENLLYLMEELAELRQTRGDRGPVLFVNLALSTPVLEEFAVEDAARQWAKHHFQMPLRFFRCVGPRKTV